MPAGSPRIDVLPAVSMKSGLEDRNNVPPRGGRKQPKVSMKSGLEDRNNYAEPVQGP